jgi:ribonuclease VapC
VVLDSSAIVAIHLRERGFEQLVMRIAEADRVVVGAPTVLETVMVLSSRLGRDAHPVVQSFFTGRGVEVIPFTEAHLDVATKAFLRFGKGRHAAALNFGDCMAYATAALSGMPLLFTGNDFAKTDIRSAS